MENNRTQQERNWRTILAWFLRIGILISGIYQTFLGDTPIGLLILLSWSIITFPSFFTRSKITYIPLEIEILFFFMVIVQFILGEAHDFYDIPYYDKFVHWFLPAVVGLVSFLIFFTLYATGRLKVTKKAMVLLVILIAMGVGAGWEIFEYSSDQLLYGRIEWWPHFQGNEHQDANQDTMGDLIADTVGGTFGAILALRYTKRAIKKKSKRFPEMIKEIAFQLKTF